MAKRLQVILKDAEYRDIQRMAMARGISISEWVRQALENARRRGSSRDIKKKLAAIRAAAVHDAEPAVDIDTMLAQIERGYTSGQP